MKKLFLFSLLLVFMAIMITCSKEEASQDPIPTPGFSFEGTSPIPPAQQRTGDAAAGYDYLVAGDYVSSGIPYGAFTLVSGTGDNFLNRTGDNADIPYEFTAVDAPNGIRVVAPNCMQCHAAKINDEFILGLGSHDYDFTKDQSDILPTASAVISSLYGGANSPEFQAYDPFRKAVEATAPYLVTETIGVNPADKIAAILAAHRDPWSLEWNDQPSEPISPLLIPTDVPAWWLLKKKNAMFYTAIGRDDFCRFMMSSSLLTMSDSTKARAVDDKFNDVLAFINSIEAPTYPFPINTTLAEQGERLYDDHCGGCHGSYGADASYPNLLVNLDRVGTDPMLSEAYQNQSLSGFINWFNDGWFSQNPGSAQLVSDGGYVAQPLDGIWATAPYLHNASVPTLEDLLNSTQRPTYWKRTYQSSDYDTEKVGWNYSTPDSKVDKKTYDTTLPGYGNQGHRFGDKLSSSERTALIEYLKTL